MKNKKVVKATPKEVDVKVLEPTKIDDLISQGMTANADIVVMEKLFNLKVRHEDREAKKAYDEAMANFQKECPIIDKRKPVKNKDGKTIRYYYAPLDDIVAQVKEVIGNNGLSYRVKANVKDNSLVEAVCVITHKLGHKEESSFEVPIDKESYMSAPQQFASALTFAKRYAFCNAFGILTGDQDDDAQNTKTDAPTKPVKTPYETATEMIDKYNTKEELEIVKGNIEKQRDKFESGQVAILFEMIKVKIEKVVDVKETGK
jgi:hypothetical protein